VADSGARGMAGGFRRLGFTGQCALLDGASGV
jgi:hypothetical protein